MKETLLQALYIMRIVLIAAVVVSVGAYLFDTEPPKEDKPQYFEIGNSGERTEITVQLTEEIEKTDDVAVKHREDEKAELPFDFKVTVTVKKRFNMPFETESVYQTPPNNSMASALEELERRKKYFICKRWFCCRQNKTIK